MALPPTLLYDYIMDDDEETFFALKSARLLSMFGRFQRRAVVRLIHKTREAFAQEDHDMPGPNEDDLVVQALMASSYLNRKGKWMGRTPKYD